MDIVQETSVDGQEDSQTGTPTAREGGTGGAGGVPPLAAGTPSPAALDLNRTIINQDEDDDKKIREEEIEIEDRFDSRIRIKQKRCSSRTCPICGPRKGYETRAVLTEKAELFERPALTTLTVDQAGTKTGKGFDSEYEAWEYVTKGGYISRLMIAGSITRWVWVLEFQKNGWPHWHILLNLSKRCKYGELARELWRLWRDLWQIGGCDLSVKTFKNPIHGVNYITKYLTKPGNFPAWFLKMRKVRVIQGSRAVGRLVMGEQYEASDKKPTGKRKAETRPVYKRIAACGQETDLIAEAFNPATGEYRVRYLGSVPATLQEVLEDTNAQKVSGVVPHMEVAMGNYGAYFQYDLINALPGDASTADLFEKLARFYGLGGHYAEHKRAIENTERALLEDYNSASALIKATRKIPQTVATNIPF